MVAELNDDFSNEEIKKACSQLNNGRSGGPDLMLNEFFLNMDLAIYHHTLHPCLTHF